MRGVARGFAFGSVVLIALYVALQPNSAAAAETGGNILVQGLRRLLSADVAGIPVRNQAAAQARAAASSSPGLGDTVGAVLQPAAPGAAAMGQAAIDAVNNVLGGQGS